MKNLGYLNSIYLLLSESFFKSKSELKEYLIKCFVSLFFALLFGYVLIKIYEVPVYYTKIDTVLINSEKKEGDGLNIKIVRDYDRADKGTIILDSDVNDSLLPKDGVLGGVFINGKFHYKGYSSNEDSKVCDTIVRITNDAMYRYGKKAIENPQIVYVATTTSLRQDFAIHINTYTEDHMSFENKYLSTEYYIGEHKKKKEYYYNDFFWYYIGNSSSNKNGRKVEEYYVASERDSILFIDYVAPIYTYQKPSIIKTAEDISKIVEVIEIGHSMRDHSAYAGAWAKVNSLEINYIGPAEFSEHISPQPDKTTLSSIVYTDPEKIKMIGHNGLKFHVKFPDMENIQEARIFIISSVVTGLFALFFRYLFFSLREIWKKVHRKMNSIYYVTLIIIAVVIILVFIYLFVLSSNVSSFEIDNEIMSVS